MSSSRKSQMKPESYKIGALLTPINRSSSPKINLALIVAQGPLIWAVIFISIIIFTAVRPTLAQKTLHIGSKNKKYLYLLGHNLISETKSETDLGILMSDNLSWSEHVANCAKKANRTLGMIKHTFSHMDKNMFISLYQTLVRPHMEYSHQVWSPYLQKDISILEKVQRRATKIVPGLEDLPYEQRLKILKLYPLEERRTRGDMICVWKMLNGQIDIDYNRLIPLNEGCDSTRSHRFQILGKVCKNNSRKNFFTQRVIHPWNTLSRDTVNSTTIDRFKGRYDKERLGNYLN